MTKTEHANRTRKAIAIADRLQAVDCDADTAAQLTDAVWAQAARAAAICYAEQHKVEVPRWTDASEATRAMVIALLTDRDRGRFERADSLHPTSVTAANAHDAMADVIAAYLAATAAPTDAVLNDRCPWPERRGLLATMVRTDGCDHVHPVAGLGPDEVVVFVHEDPLYPSPRILPNGLPWSCVVDRDCLTLLADLPPDTDLRTVLRHWETDPETPTCDHPNVAYCDECDPDPQTRQYYEHIGVSPA